MNNGAYPRFSERCFYLSPLYTISGWYYRVRGGHSNGPYYDKEHAQQAAQQYARDCSQRRDSGGRPS